MRGRPLTVLTVLLLAAAIPGCGGTGSHEPEGPVTVVLDAVGVETGLVYQNGWVTTYGDVDAGDNGNGPPVRAFVSFQLAPIPPNATVLSATLTLHQYYVGGAPYSKLGPLVVDHVIYGTVLEAGAYTRSPLASDIGVLSTDPGLGPRSVDVTTRVQEDLLSGHPQSQYRVRFAVEDSGDAVADFVDYYGPSPYTPPYARPALVVTYQ